MDPANLDPMAGNAGFVQPSCGAPVAPVTGPLCGPSTAPCRRIAEHSFDQLDGEPAVSLAFADDAVHVLQERAAPTYFVPATDSSPAVRQEIPGPTMKDGDAPLVSLALDDEGVAVALLYGWQPGTTEIWRRGADASGWTFESRTQADLVERNRLLAGAGCLHAALLLSYEVSGDYQVNPVYAVHDGRWQEFRLGPPKLENAGAPALALDAGGTPHLAYWKATSRGYGLYHAIPGRTLEAVGATGTATPEGVQHLPSIPLLSVTADQDGETVVHTVRAFMERKRNAQALALATRRNGVWTEREVVRWAPISDPSCAMDESCTYTEENVEARALFASAGGDLRLFVERHTHTRTGSGPAMDAKDELLIGWPDGDGFTFAPYDGPVPEAVSPEGHFWAQRRDATSDSLTLVVNGP